MENEAEQNLTKNKSSQWKYKLAVVLLLLLVIFSLFFILLTQETKPDPASELEIRWLTTRRLSVEIDINKNPNELTYEDFAKVKILDLIRKQLKDIILLDKFTGLQRLDLINISYPNKDVPQWMKILAKLRIYHIDKTFELDLKPIKKLYNLQIININKTQVTNIKPLANLSNLKKLSITDCDFSNIKPIKKLKNLEILDFRNSKVSNIKPLKGLINLKELNLNNTQVADLEPLKKLKNLEKLNISECKNIKYEQVEDLQNALPNLEIQR